MCTCGYMCVHAYMCAYIMVGFGVLEYSVGQTVFFLVLPVKSEPLHRPPPGTAAIPPWMQTLEFPMKTLARRGKNKAMSLGPALPRTQHNCTSEVIYMSHLMPLLSASVLSSFE